MSSVEKRGRHNSSKTRVEPAFDVIANGHLPEFFKFLKKELNINFPKIGDCSNVKVWYDSHSCENSEIKRNPPLAYLKYLVEHPGIINSDKIKKLKPNSKAKGPRLALLRGDKQELANAESALTNSSLGIKCENPYIFEGPTQPDVCIKTDQFYLLIEGKRTEGHLTRDTDWVKGKRDQLFRHIDAFINNTDKDETGLPLPVYALYIISEDKIETYKEQLADYKNFDKVREWLPHRSDDEIRAIMKNSYLGYTTWENLQKHFDKYHISLNYIDELS